MGESESVKVHCVLYISICGNLQSLSENVTCFLYHHFGTISQSSELKYSVITIHALILSNIFVASRFHDFKRLTYWHSLILAVSY